MSAIRTRTNASTTVDSETTRSAFKVSGNFPEPFRTLLTRSARPERTTRRPRASRRVPRARPGHPPRRLQPWFEPKSHPSRRRARFRKKRTRGSAFNFSGNFPETPDGVSRDCTDAPEHPRGSTKPPRRLFARFSRVFVPPFPYVVPFFFRRRGDNASPHVPRGHDRRGREPVAKPEPSRREPERVRVGARI